MERLLPHTESETSDQTRLSKKKLQIGTISLVFDWILPVLRQERRVQRMVVT